MSKKHWFYDHDGRVGGPVNVSELRHLAANGQILPTDQVRKEDMDRWVKAGAVKGLFAPAADEGPTGEPAFDFFGAGPPPAAAAEEFNPAFDFFGGAAQASPPAPKAVPRRKSKAAETDGGRFRLTGPSNPPAESRDEVPSPYADFQADVPMATPVFEDEAPPAAPASAVGDTVLTGPEVALQPYGTAAPTGGTVELSLDDGWLVARGDGQETHLRLACVDAVALRERSPAGLVLSVHAGGQAVAVRCDGDAEPFRVFVRRVLAAAG